MLHRMMEACLFPLSPLLHHVNDDLFVEWSMYSCLILVLDAIFVVPCSVEAIEYEQTNW